MTETFPSTPVPVQPRTGWLVRLGLCLLATVIVTAISLHIALRHKRPLNYPYYDDVAYFVDGWQKLHALRTGGFTAFAKECSMPPPHSPFSTGLAVVSFAVFGRHEWAPYSGNGRVVPEWGPYVGNGIIVLFLFLCVDLLFGSDKSWCQHVLILLLVSVTRLPADIIWNFKPDAFCGIVTAAAVVTALRRSAPHWKSALGAGVLFGFAILAKPSVSPVTLFIMAITLASAGYAQWRENRAAGIKPIVTSWAICLAAMFLLCLPYIAVGGVSSTYSYIRGVLTDSRDTWVYKGTPAEHAGYFLGGVGGWQVVGPSLWIFVVLLGIGIAHLAEKWPALSPGGAVRIFGGVLASLAAYAIPTIEVVKNQRLAITFHALLIFGAVVVLADVVRSRRRFGSALLILCAATAVGLALFPFQDPRRREYWLTQDDAEIIGLNRLAERIYNDIQGVKVSTGGQTQVLLGVMDKAINPGTLQWMALGDARPFNILQKPNNSDANTEAPYIAGTHVFVTADPQNAPPDPSDLIGPENERRLSREFLNRKDFRLIDSYQAFNGKLYYVFQRIGI